MAASSLGPPPADAAALTEVLPTIAPGPGLAAYLEAIDPEALDFTATIEVVAAYKRLEAWSASRAARAADALTQRPELDFSRLADDRGLLTVTTVVADELAPRLGMTRAAAKNLVCIGRALNGALWQTGEALENGLIDFRKAAIIHRSLENSALEITAGVESAVLPDAPFRTPPQLQRDIATAIIAVAPEEANTRAIAAMAKRRVNHPRPLPDGMASILAVLPATDAVALDLALESAARAAKSHGDSRTLDQLRADSLAFMSHTALDTGYIGPAPPCTNCSPNQHPTNSSQAPARHATGPPPPSRLPTTKPQPPSIGESPPGSGPSAPPPGESAPAGGSSPSPSGASPPPSGGSHPTSGASPPSPGDGNPPSGASPPPSSGTPPPESPDHSAQVPDRPPASLDPTQEPDPSTARKPPLPLRLGHIGGGRTKIHVTVPMSTLIRTPDQRAAHDPLQDPPVEVAQLEGYGPIPDVIAQGLAMGGVWQRLLTDPATGAILDVGRQRYQPPAALAQHVRHRDATCVAPGCSVSARSCDIDHITPWAQGGETAADNLQLLCPHHHTVKTLGGFISQRHPDGSYEFTSRTSGQRYRRHPNGKVQRLRPLQPYEIALRTDTPLPAPTRELYESWLGDPPF